MRKLCLGSIIFCCAALGYAQASAATASLSGPCPYYWTVLDGSGGTSGGAPTTTTVANSIYPALSGVPVTQVSNSGASLTYTATYPSSGVVPQPCLVGANWNNPSQLSLYQAGGGGTTDNVDIHFASAGAQGTTMSYCALLNSTEPGSGSSSYTSGDSIVLYGTAGFTNRYWKIVNPGPTLSGTEMGPGSAGQQCWSQIAPAAATYSASCSVGDSGPIFPYSQNTWQWVCSAITSTLAGDINQEQGQWDVSGNFLFYYATESSSNGSGKYIEFLGWGVGTGTSDTAPSGGKYFPISIICGLESSSAPNCPFPLISGLAAVPPSPSVGAGSIPPSTIVTLNSRSIDSAMSSPGNIYYNLSGTATCGGSSTLYNGTSLTLPSTLGAVTLSSIACPTGTNPTPSAVTNTAYTVSANPTVSSSWYYAFRSGSGGAITSNSVAASAGQLVFALCGNSSGTAFTSCVITDNASGGTNTWNPMTLFDASGVQYAQVSWSLLTYPITTITATPSASTASFGLSGIIVTCSTCSGASTPTEKGGSNVYGSTWTSSTFTASGATNGWIVVVAGDNSGPKIYNSTDTIAGQTGTLFSNNYSTLGAASVLGLYVYVSTGASLGTNQTGNYTVSSATHLIGDVIAFPW